MGRVSTCQKNCNTIDLRRAQVNKELWTIQYRQPQIYKTIWFLFFYLYMDVILYFTPGLSIFDLKLDQ